MKKALIMITVMTAGLILSACGDIKNTSSDHSSIKVPAVTLPDSSSVPDDDPSVPVPPDTEPETMKFFSSELEELDVSEDEAYGGKVYNGNDFLIRSSSGYIGEFESSANFIIETQKSLDSFCEKYDIEIDSSDFFDSLGNKSTPDVSSDIPSINGYHVVVTYSGYSFDGSHPKAGGVLIKDDMMRFVCTAASLSRGEYEGADEFPEVMDGYLFIAAVPVTEFRSFSYPGWEYLADEDTEPEPEPVSAPDPDTGNADIVLLYRYQNWAWGVQDSGMFIDASGAAYRFEFANGESYDYETLSGKEFMDELRKIQESEAPEEYVDKGLIEEIIRLIPEVNKNAERTEEYVACDAGQHTIYVVEGDELTELWSTGDTDRRLLDPAAEKIRYILENS